MTHTVPVAMYDRLSTTRQAEEGYALEGHLHELRAAMATQGRKIVAEVADPGEKRWMFERPGLDRIKELARTGQIEEVWAWSWTRYGESPVPEVLAVELAEHDVVLRSLDDGGEGLGGEIVRAVRGVLSREEQRDRVRKAAMGKRSKVRGGKVLGISPRPRYGFEYLRDAKGNIVGYAVHEPEMRVVRRIIGMLAEGCSIYAVQTALEMERVPAPQGGDRWHRPTIKDIVQEDTYRSHTLGELADLVSEGLMSREVYDTLEEGRTYGVSYYGRTRSSYVSTRSKKRKVEQVPREQWTAVPLDLSGSGPDREEVERARRAVADNRASSRSGERTWELSRGFLFCVHCGRAMSANTRRFPEQGKAYYSYRCRHDGPITRAKCVNRKSHPAAQLEHEAAALFEQYANQGTLLELYDRALAAEGERLETGAVLERQAALAEKRSELELERRGYLRQAARSVLSDEELDDLLGEVDEQREAITAELAAVEERASAAQRLRAARDSLSAEWYEDPDALAPDQFLTLGATPEEIRRAYRKHGARFEVDKDGLLTLRLSLATGGGLLHLESSS